MEQTGTEALFDAFLFLTIISVTSCVIPVSMSENMHLADSERRDAAIKYAATSLDAMLSATMQNASYSDRNGSRVELGNGTTVKEFLLDETYLCLQGWPYSSFEESNRYVERLARKLIAPAYRYRLMTGLGEDGDNHVVELGDLDDAIGFASSSDFIIQGVKIRIALVLWWA